MNSHHSHLPSSQRLAYQALSPLGESQAHVRFEGLFEQREVTWDARILTLAEVYRQLCETGQRADDEAVTLRQFIDIGEAQGSLQPVTIALNVPRIDAPTVFKTIVMIHNYKRLHRGRHEYGPGQVFP